MSEFTSQNLFFQNLQLSSLFQSEFYWCRVSGLLCWVRLPHCLNIPLQDLIEDLKSELGGHFEDVIVALVIPPVDYLCKQLHKAMEGVGTNEHTLIEILCSKSNTEVGEIVTAYERCKWIFN